MSTEPTRQQVRQQLWLQTVAALTHPQLPIKGATDGADAVLAAYDRTFPAPAPLKIDEVHNVD